MPATANTPARIARTNVVGPGSGSPIASATTVMIAAPIRSTVIAIERTGARRPAHPPLKSPAPQATAEASPKTTTARLGPAGAAGGASRDRLGPAVVDLGRPGEGDDRIRCGVVAIGAGQVDHLEVLRDLAQQLERPERARVVERHERIVEDERCPAVAGDEPDQPEPGGEEDEVERALAERADV